MMIFTNLSLDKFSVLKTFKETLDDDQKKIYRDITEERRNIYYRGFLLGLVLSILLIYFLNGSSFSKIGKPTTLCIIGATSFLTNYFYYILTPKSDYMLLHLNNKKQIEEWLNVYKIMQYVNHLGFALGIVGVVFLGNAFCNEK
tara:strand:+ start:77 stop:508 length:432 start_codon:yes stop_codon:yes gene_type:complete